MSGAVPPLSGHEPPILERVQADEEPRIDGVGIDVVTPEFSQCCGVERGGLWGVQMKACVPGAEGASTAPVMSLNQGRWDAVSKATGLACFPDQCFGSKRQDTRFPWE